MKHCTSCGAELQPHWKFCTNCQAPQPAETGSETSATSAAEADAGRNAETQNAGSPQDDGLQTTQFPAQQPTQQMEQPRAQQQPLPAGIPAAATSVFDPPVAAPAVSLAHSGSVQGNPVSGSSDAEGPGAGGPADGGSSGGGPSGPQGPAGSGASSSGGRKPSRRKIILISVLALLVVLGLAAFFFVQNLIRGGAGSAESAADKVVEAIESKDFIGLATMVPPEEREPLQRLQEHLGDKAEEFRLEEAVGKISDSEEEIDTELTFDGINISFDGVEPEVTEIDENTALIKYTSGEARFELDPAETTGAIRSGLEAAGLEDEEKIDETVQLSEMGPDGTGLTLVATERSGRWYVSPLYSIAEMISASEGYDRGSVPETAGGSESPAAAAKAAVEAVPDAVSEGSLNPLAGTLSIHEGSLLFLYQDMFDDIMAGAGGEELNIADVRFAEGEKDGDRAVAVVENISVESEYGDKITLTSECIEGERESDSVCFNDSGYSIEPSMQMLGGAKIMSLTTIEEDGKWRVSLGHTVTDWIINWTDSLTREQALAMLQLGNSEDAAGDISVDESTEVEFNSAGFAVLNLTVDEEMVLEAEEDFGEMLLYSEDGKEQITNLGWGEDVEAGSYKLVVFAGSDWQEEFAEKGNDVEYSSELTLVEAEEWSYMDEYASMEFFSDTFSQGSGAEPNSHTLSGTKDESEIQFTASGMNDSKTPMTVVVSLDGKEHAVEVTADKDGYLTIPYPNDGEEHEVVVSLRVADPDEAWIIVSYTGELREK